MSAQELELPFYLYTEKKGTDGIVTGLTYKAEKLVAWAESGRGDAVDKLCAQGLVRASEAIADWQANQVL